MLLCWALKSKKQRGFTRQDAQTDEEQEGQEAKGPCGPGRVLSLKEAKGQALDRGRKKPPAYKGLPKERVQACGMNKNMQPVKP